MSTERGLFAISPQPPGMVFRPSPIRLLTILTILIFFAEIGAMLVLYFLPIKNYALDALLDGVMMILLILPGLYYLQLRPLIIQIEQGDQVERALRTNEELLRKVLELLPVGILIIDNSGKIVHGNPRSQHIWGSYWSAGFQRYDELKGWWANTGNQVNPEEWAANRAIKRGETSLHEEIEIETLDGSRKIILNSAVPILDEHELIQGAVVVNQDITNRRRAEKERIRLNELLDRFFYSISTLIAYMDRDFNFIRVNDTYARAGGHPPEFYAGKNHFELYPNEENEAIFRRVVETGEPFSVLEKEFKYDEYPERGSTYWDWSLQPVKGVDGLVEGVVLSLVDVTDRKLADLKLADQNEELRALYVSESRARQFAEILSTASQALTETLDLSHVINTLLDYIEDIVPADTALVTLLQDETHLVVRAVRGNIDTLQQDKNASHPIDIITDSVFQRLKMTRKSMILPSTVVPIAEGQVANLQQNYTWLVVPLVASQKIIGLVELGKVGDGKFTTEHVVWAEAIVAQAAVAVQNAWLFEQVRSSSERLQSLARKLVEIQENERYHIARELHDEAGQALSSLKLSLGRLEQSPDCPQHLRQRLQELKIITDGVLEELHRLAIDLRPIALDHLGLVAALEQYASKLNSDQLSVHFKAVGLGNKRLPRDVETSLYRIVQEALTNVVCHAQASNVSILVKRQKGRVRLLIEDNGIGIPPDLMQKEDRLGLVGMRERAEMFGGSLSIESFPGKGTSIIVEVPDVDPHPYR